MIKLTAQLVGIVAMVCSVSSMQMNKHKKIMLLQFFTALCFGIQFLMLGAITGACSNLVAVIRDVIFYYKEDKRWANSKWWIVLFSVLYIIIGIITYKNIWDGIFAFSMIVNTLSFSFTNPKYVRRIILISSPMMLIYSIVYGSVGGIINESFTIISSLVGMLRYDITLKK